MTPSRYNLERNYFWRGTYFERGNDFLTLKTIQNWNKLCWER